VQAGLGINVRPVQKITRAKSSVAQMEVYMLSKTQCPELKTLFLIILSNRPAE
jgi:hypothetical protein